MKWKFAILKKKERKHIFIHVQQVPFVNPKCASGDGYSIFSCMVENGGKESKCWKEDPLIMSALSTWIQDYRSKIALAGSEDMVCRNALGDNHNRQTDAHWDP